MWQVIAAGGTNGAAPNDAFAAMLSTSGGCGPDAIWVA